MTWEEEEELNCITLVRKHICSLTDSSFAKRPRTLLSKPFAQVCWKTGPMVTCLPMHMCIQCPEIVGWSWVWARLEDNMHLHSHNDCFSHSWRWFESISSHIILNKNFIYVALQTGSLLLTHLDILDLGWTLWIYWEFSHILSRPCPQVTYWRISLIL